MGELESATGVDSGMWRGCDEGGGWARERQREDDPLKRADLALIIQLVVEGTLDGGIHDSGPLERVSGPGGHASWEGGAGGAAVCVCVDNESGRVAMPVLSGG